MTTQQDSQDPQRRSEESRKGAVKQSRTILIGWLIARGTIGPHERYLSTEPHDQDRAVQEGQGNRTARMHKGVQAVDKDRTAQRVVGANAQEWLTRRVGPPATGPMVKTRSREALMARSRGGRSKRSRFKVGSGLDG